GEVSDIPEQLDAIIAKAMAKRPEDRFGSARELVAALGEALRELDTAERTVAAGAPVPSGTEPPAPTVVTDDAATHVVLPSAAAAEPAAPAHARPAEPAKGPVTASPPAASRLDEPPAPARTSRRSPVLWVAPILVLSLVGVLVATFSDVHSNGGTTAT